ncbi:hypothetical protein [Brevibacillus sp. SYSU BS000544]|uniref:hypothetical protein n=1 Tax=Brevibacillus sp. SYSU BS000544 TaxID=3416443 RepID=UPI003CE4F813
MSLPVDNRFCFDMAETIRYMDQQVNRDHLPLEKEYSGASVNHPFVLEWIEPDGTQNWLAKVKYTGSTVAPLSERFQNISEAVCFVAASVWMEQYGRTTSVSSIQQIECLCDWDEIDEFFVLFERLSATHNQYRGDAILHARDGRLLARWEDIRGERFFN